MSKTFSNSGKSAFGVFLESQTASDYLYNKKAKNIYCLNNTKNIKNNFSYENNFLLKRANQLKCMPYYYIFNKSNLNINLITYLNLQNIPVITPQRIDTQLVPYLTYNIDPNGYLFGNNICGLNNYTKFMMLNIN